jgi:hypothetical protein
MKSDVKKKMTSFSHPATTPKSLEGDDGEQFREHEPSRARVKQVFFMSSAASSQFMIVFIVLDFRKAVLCTLRIVCA